jgi:hypothetical protein
VTPKPFESGQQQSSAHVDAVPQEEGRRLSARSPAKPAHTDIGAFPVTHLQDVLDRVMAPGADRQALAREYVREALAHSRSRLISRGEQ